MLIVMTKQKTNYVTLIIVFVIGISLGVIAVSSTKNQSFAPTPQVTTASINLPAVDENGNGVTTPLEVEVTSGNGKVLTNIDKLLFWIDTQYSIQVAKTVAGQISGIDTNKYDITYTIEGGNTTLIGGPSAGAALTIATIAALENKTLKKDVMITGTINPDGTIGKVGAILEKAKAAKEIGAKLFLVPVGESTQSYLKPNEKCTNALGFIYCVTTYTTQNVNIGESVGISVIEVATIRDAMKYFFY